MTESWPALPVSEWAPTRETLHMWVQIVGKLRMAGSPPLNHWWHTTLFLTARGLGTGPLAAGGEVVDLEFDFVDHCLTTRSSNSTTQQFALAGLSVATFYAQVVQLQERLGLSPIAHPSPNEVATAVPFAEDTKNDSYVPEQAHAFWRQLVIADRLLRRLRADFRGKASPVHFFWGAMDLATTRFSGRSAPQHPGGAPNCPDEVMYEGYSDELSSAGFWPGGGLEGAFYSYAYPGPEGFAAATVPQGSYWDTDLGEFVLPWEVARASSDPDALVLDFLRATASAAEDLAHWPGR